MQGARKYGLFVAVGATILIPVILFGIIENNDRNLLSLLLSNIGINQDDGTTQQQQQQMENEDIFLRGAVDANSEGKQISEKLRRHLCGSSILPETTEFIQEFQIPFSCAQPVGLATDSKGKVWVASTWTGHLLVFDTASERFVKTIQIPDWKTKSDFGSKV